MKRSPRPATPDRPARSEDIVDKPGHKHCWPAFQERRHQIVIHPLSILVSRDPGRHRMVRHPVYYFHCTDGVSFFADREGGSVTRDDEIFLAAMRTAERFIERLPSTAGWSGWLVCVYDQLGQMVEVYDFPNL